MTNFFKERKLLTKEQFLQKSIYCFVHLYIFLTIIRIYIYKREVSVCLFVCLFGFEAQTTGRIPTKFGMGHPLVYVGNLENLFWVDPPRGGV